jgi:hypothetical protein
VIAAVAVVTGCDGDGGGGGRKQSDTMGELVVLLEPVLDTLPVTDSVTATETASVTFDWGGEDSEVVGTADSLSPARLSTRFNAVSASQKSVIT